MKETVLIQEDNCSNSRRQPTPNKHTEETILALPRKTLIQNGYERNGSNSRRQLF